MPVGAAGYWVNCVREVVGNGIAVGVDGASVEVGGGEVSVGGGNKVFVGSTGLVARGGEVGEAVGGCAPVQADISTKIPRRIIILRNIFRTIYLLQIYGYQV
jgi:hypothetical protein